MSDGTRPASILSHGERAVAAQLVADPDRSPAAIAEALDLPEETVRKAISRIRDKTRRAAVTLAESPFAAEVARDLDEETRASLHEILSDAVGAGD